MKHAFSYAAAVCCLLAAVSCSKSETDDAVRGTRGTMELTVAGTRSDSPSGEYDPLQHLSVRIYDDKGALLRRYTSQEGIPERYELLASDYRIAVEAGEEAAASFTVRHYAGEEPFTVTAGATTPVEVTCRRTSVAAQVSFEQNVASAFGDNFAVWVAAGDTADETQIAQGSLAGLEFTADATGYFTLPEGVRTLAWKFRGEHASRGEIVKEGTLDVEPGDNCALKFRFSPDLPGFIECFTITVDDSTDDWDDTFVWADITIEGDGFDMEQTQEYAPGTPKSYLIGSAASIATATLAVGDELHDLLNAAPAGVAVERTDERHLTVTLNDDFFAGRPAGVLALTFRVTDANGGELERSSSYRLQGLLPIEKTDWSLWSRSLTLRASAANPDAEVLFTLRTAEGEEQLPGVRNEEGIHTATFAPGWTTSENANGLTCHTPDGKGLRVGTHYTCVATIDGVEYTATLDTPAGDVISNAGMDDWSTYVVAGWSVLSGEVPYPNADSGTIFWVGGNNKQTNALCTGAEIEGSNGRCAQLKPMVAAGVFAAGNLFTGTFEGGPNFLDMYGLAHFGVVYDFTARPTALSLRYNATITNVTHTGNSSLTTEELDQSRIFVCITDWTARHTVKSGSSYDETTFWDPEAATSLPEGAILGYGSQMLTESTGGWQTLTIPIVWYDREAAPAAGNYSLVISCATSFKGDYVAGSENNVLYVEDFEWVY